MHSTKLRYKSQSSFSMQHYKKIEIQIYHLFTKYNKWRLVQSFSLNPTSCTVFLLCIFAVAYCPHSLQFLQNALFFSTRNYVHNIMTVKISCVRVCTLSLTMTEEKLTVVENRMQWRIFRTAVPTVRSMNPQGIRDQFPKIRGYISVMLYFEVYLFCN